MHSSISLHDLRVRLLQMVMVPGKNDRLRKVTEQKRHICLLLVGRRHTAHPLLMVLMVHHSFSQRKAEAA